MDIFLEFGNQHSAAAVHHQLGILAQEQRHFEKAETSYREAPKIRAEFGDRHAAAQTFGQLGILALEQLRFGEAEANFRMALDIFLNLTPPAASAPRLGWRP